MKHKTLILLALLLSIGMEAQNVKTVYNKSKSSIVLIVTYDSNNVPLALGSGFYFEKNLIATNYHVIKGCSRILIKNLGTHEKSYNVKIKSYSKELDVAILEVDKDNSTYLKLSNTTPSVGDKIIAIGNPQGLEGTVSTGIVSGIRDLSKLYHLIQITSPISPGSSGGPVLDLNGKVIGISTFTLLNSQNLNFAIPVNTILAIKNHKTIKLESNIKNNFSASKNRNSVSLTYFAKQGSEFNESVSLKNNTNQTIKNIKGLLLFYNMNGTPISYQYIEVKDLLMPGMAKLKVFKSFDQNQKFSYAYGKDFSKEYYTQFTVKFRLLNYDIVKRDITNELIGN